MLSDAARKAAREDLDRDFKLTLDRVNSRLASHEKMKKLIVVKDPWTVEAGLMTPTLKIKRHVLEDRYQGLVDQGYAAREAVVWEH